MKKLIFAALLAMSAIPAAAATTTTTFIGVIGDIQGTTPIFGAGVTYGTAYQLVYTVNDQTPGATSFNNASSSGISGVGVVTTALTINGITKIINGSASSSAQNDNAAGPYSTDFSGRTSTEYSVTATNYHSYSASSSISSHAFSFLPDADYHTSFSYQPVGDDSYGNYVFFNDYSYETHTYAANLYLNLAPGLVTSVTTAAPVPEAGEWAMIFAGLGVVSAAARRRRSA